MRRLKPPKPLEAATVIEMSDQAALVAAAADPKAEADRLYKNARQAIWFENVTAELKRISGPGTRCMYCSGSEASDVEHYRPKAIFPEKAFDWNNYLWSCTPCNRSKLNRFPPKTGPGALCINPLKENVWNFFFIDEFGFMSPLWDVGAGRLNARAETTDSLLALNREGVQETRHLRLVDLKRQVKLLLHQLKTGQITKAKAKRLVVTLRSQPFQPDVADFFLRGPGKSEAPFVDLFTFLVAP